MTYSYGEATAVLGPLSPAPVPGAIDLCANHAQTFTVPHGWTMVRLVTEFEPVPPSDSDLMALANAIRETSKKEVPPPARSKRDIVRESLPRPGRAHLQAVPEPDDDEGAR